MDLCYESIEGPQPKAGPTHGLPRADWSRHPQISILEKRALEGDLIPLQQTTKRGTSEIFSWASPSHKNGSERTPLHSTLTGGRLGLAGQGRASGVKGVLKIGIVQIVSFLLASL